MNDWDNLADAGDKSQGSEFATATKQDAKVMEHTAAKNNNKTMYLAMGGLMLFVMGVFGYTKYAEFQHIQNAEQKERQQLAKKSSEEEVKEKAKKEPETNKPAQANTQAEAAEGQMKTAQQQAASDELNALSQLKSKNGEGQSAQTQAMATTVALNQAPVVAKPVANVQPEQLPQTQSAAGNLADAQKRDNYIRLLEARVNELGISKMRLEAEICKYEPGRNFCGASAKSAALATTAKTSPQITNKPIQTQSDPTGRVMLFDTNQASVRRTENGQPGSRMSSTTSHLASQESQLPGLTILRDRVLYRDRDGMTQEVELGGQITGLGKLERIDFENKSFQAGGRNYN